MPKDAKLIKARSLKRPNRPCAFGVFLSVAFVPVS